ncbi:MAG: hypothetical protein HPM95_00370 [Alphaproteobacteria bacterium]|nr:hypothetical protein [Alphaproteobacteria bacterium]
MAGAVRAVLASCDALALTMRESAGVLRIAPVDPLRVEEALAALALDDDRTCDTMPSPQR